MYQKLLKCFIGVSIRNAVTELRCSCHFKDDFVLENGETATAESATVLLCS